MANGDSEPAPPPPFELTDKVGDEGVSETAERLTDIAKRHGALAASDHAQRSAHVPSEVPYCPTGLVWPFRPESVLQDIVDAQCDAETQDALWSSVAAKWMGWETRRRRPSPVQKVGRSGGDVLQFVRGADRRGRLPQYPLQLHVRGMYSAALADGDTVPVVFLLSSYQSLTASVAGQVIEKCAEDWLDIVTVDDAAEAQRCSSASAVLSEMRDAAVMWDRCRSLDDAREASGRLVGRAKAKAKARAKARAKSAASQPTELPVWAAVALDQSLRELRVRQAQGQVADLRDCVSPVPEACTEPVPSSAGLRANSSASPFGAAEPHWVSLLSRAGDKVTVRVCKAGSVVVHFNDGPAEAPGECIDVEVSPHGWPRLRVGCGKWIALPGSQSSIELIIDKLAALVNVAGVDLNVPRVLAGVREDAAPEDDLPLLFVECDLPWLPVGGRYIRETTGVDGTVMWVHLGEDGRMQIGRTMRGSWVFTGEGGDPSRDQLWLTSSVPVPCLMPHEVRGWIGYHSTSRQYTDIPVDSIRMVALHPPTEELVAARRQRSAAGGAVARTAMHIERSAARVHRAIASAEMVEFLGLLRGFMRTRPQPRPPQ